MAAVPYIETPFRYRVVGRCGQDIQIENDEFALRMPLDVFERGAAEAREVIAKDRLARLGRGQIVAFPARLQPV